MLTPSYLHYINDSWRLQNRTHSTKNVAKSKKWRRHLPKNRPLWWDSSSQKFLLDSVTDHKSGSLVGFVLKSKLGSLDHRKYDDDVWEDQREVETVGAKTKIKPLVMRDDWAFSNKFLGFEWISSRHEKWFNYPRRKGAWPNTLCVEKLEIQTDQLMNGCKTIWLC